ncbi:MAG: hypothetical protein EP335_01810 [Alphaproteobacteria bacterium]|nr:MAG: hypothetical protein EP335_01810 [Alphaproteobacteria bacterium]
MVSSGTKKLSVLAFCGLLAACAGKDSDWPTLAEPLPDASARERVAEAPLPREKPEVTHVTEPQTAMMLAVPAKPGHVVEERLPKSALEAETMLTGIKEDLRADTLAYREAVAKIGPLAGDDRLDAWYDAQAALTRLSQTASRLDMLTESDLPDIASVAKAAGTEAGIMENFVVGERQRLASLKP